MKTHWYTILIPEDELSYKELSKAFNDIYLDWINAFKKKFLQKKMILKLEKENNYLFSALDSLKETHTSLVDERFNVYDTLIEKVEKVVCATYMTLKLELENLKKQLIHALSLSYTNYTSSSDKGIFLRKTLTLLEEIKKSILSKAMSLLWW